MKISCWRRRCLNTCLVVCDFASNLKIKVSYKFQRRHSEEALHILASLSHAQSSLPAAALELAICSKCSGRHHWAVMCKNPRNSHLMQYQQHQRNTESRRETPQKYSSGTKPKKKYKKVYELVEEDSEEESNGERGY